MLGIRSSELVDFSEMLKQVEYYDSDIGQYRYSIIEDRWYGEVAVPQGDLVVCGAGEFPQSFEKTMITELTPKFIEVSELVKSTVPQPDGCVDENLPSDLAPHRMTICSTEEVELYFRPGVDVEEDYVWLMATLNSKGELIKTEWIA